MKEQTISLLSRFSRGELRTSVYIGSAIVISLLVILSFVLSYSIVRQATEIYLYLYNPKLLLGAYWGIITGITIFVFA